MSSLPNTLGASDALRGLIALESQAHQTYKSVETELENIELKIAVEAFGAEHLRRARELNAWLKQRQTLIPRLRETMVPRQKGNPILRDPLPDTEILAPLLRLENALDAAYVGLLRRGDLEAELGKLLERFLAEERHCASWLDDRWQAR